MSDAHTAWRERQLLLNRIAELEVENVRLRSGIENARPCAWDRVDCRDTRPERI